MWAFEKYYSFLDHKQTNFSYFTNEREEYKYTLKFQFHFAWKGAKNVKQKVTWSILHNYWILF